jgi:creatinine amidohydrolase
MMPKRKWADMTWTEVAAGDTSRWIAVLPVAAVEQHGPHLPLGTDSDIAEAYVGRVLPLLPDNLPATFLPVQQIGYSDEHLAFPGTLSLSAPTLIAAWTEIGESVRRCGVRKLVIITSHGGNAALLDPVARDLRVRLKMLVVTCAWHRFDYPPGTFTAQEQHHGIHAGDVETSLILAHKPDAVQMKNAVAAVPATLEMADTFKWLSAFKPAGFGWMTQDLHPTGAVGDATAATAGKGKQALEHGARAFVELLQDVDRFDLARLADGPLDLDGGGTESDE